MDARVEEILASMDMSNEAARRQAADIAASVRSSPYLQRLMADAIQRGRLEHIEVGPSTDKRMGAFDDARHAIVLAPSLFRAADSAVRHDGLTDVLGHETAHAILAPHREEKISLLSRHAYVALGNPPEDRVVDVTALVGDYIRLSRIDEAAAEAHGWNALRSRIDAERPGPVTEAEVARRAMNTSACVVMIGGTPRLDPRIERNADQSMVIDARGIHLDDIGKCHFDRPGPAGGADYANHYGAAAISTVLAQELDFRRRGMQPNEIQIDLRKLGLNVKQLEQAGIDLGARRESFQLTDISDGNARWIELTHTRTPDVHSRPQELRVEEDARATGHPDHPLFKQTEAGVHRLDASMGRMPDASSESMTASLFALAKERGFRSVDHVLLSIESEQTRAGQNVFIVQGDLSHPGKLRAHMATADAIAQPVEASLARVAALSQPSQDQQFELEQSQQRGPTLSR